MADLIPLVSRALGAETIQTVNARELHAFLQVKTLFKDWIQRRIQSYGFLQGIDFICSSDLSSDNPNPAMDYHISLSMAKELAMVERTGKGREARHYFIECERRALLSHTPQPVALHAPQAHLDTIRLAKDLLEDLGCLTPRDTLMLADQVRNVMQVGQRLLSAPGDNSQQAAYGFSISERIAQLGYRLTRSQESALSPKLGKMVADEFRSRYAREPLDEPRYVDGARRNVKWYAEDEHAWIDPILVGYLVQFPGLPRLTQGAI